jgi:hypothetical protein
MSADHHHAQRSPATRAAANRSFAGAHSLASDPGRSSHHHAGTGSPVLDIGGDVGALIATMDERAAGSELFVRPDHDPRTTVHTGVWERVHDGETVTAAVFPELAAGTYHVLDERGAALRTVEIRGGAVVTIDLRD